MERFVSIFFCQFFHNILFRIQHERIKTYIIVTYYITRRFCSGPILSIFDYTVYIVLQLPVDENTKKCHNQLILLRIEKKTSQQ